MKASLILQIKHFKYVEKSVNNIYKCKSSFATVNIVPA
jgi:hypothetical protein